MWVWVNATPKAHATPEAIAERRQLWVGQGRDDALKARCRFVQRYVAEQRSPLRVLWLLDTDDPGAVRLLTDHFGDLWDLEVIRVTPQAFGQVPSKGR
jgi:hypothetical protein